MDVAGIGDRMGRLSGGGGGRTCYADIMIWYIVDMYFGWLYDEQEPKYYHELVWLCVYDMMVCARVFTKLLILLIIMSG